MMSVCSSGRRSVQATTLLWLLSCFGGCRLLCAQVWAASMQPVSVASTCSLLHLQLKGHETVDPALLLAAYNAQVRFIRSLHVIGFARGQSGREYGIGDQAHELPVIIDFVRPDLLRVSGPTPSMGSRGFEMTSDGKEFRLLVPENGKKTFLMGPVDAPGHSLHPRENLRPQPLIDALRWQEGKLRKETNISVQDAREQEGTQTVTFALPPEPGKPSTGRIVFDIEHGVVDSLTTYDPSGEEQSVATYGGWAPMSADADASPVGCYPRNIHVIRSGGDYELNVRITDISANPNIPLSKFRPAPPRGIPVIQVDMSGNAVRR